MDQNVPRKEERSMEDEVVRVPRGQTERPAGYRLKERVPHVRVRVPASSANIGPGFDTLGIALDLPLWLDVTVASQTRIVVHGEVLQGLPTDESNLLYRAMEKVYAYVGEPMPSLHIEVYSAIPLARGLGSSAAAIVAAIVAADQLLAQPLSLHQQLMLAAQMEGHPDNVAAALYGGVVIASPTDSGFQCVRLSPPPALSTLVAVPAYVLSTQDARAVLPQSVSFADAVHNVSHTALLVAALATGDLSLLADAMRDRLHEPYRAKLVPGLAKALAGAVAHGALGCALSGAGPTVLVFVAKQQLLTGIAGFMKQSFARPQPPTLLSLEIATEGATVSTTHTEPFLSIVMRAERQRQEVEVRV